MRLRAYAGTGEVKSANRVNSVRWNAARLRKKSHDFVHQSPPLVCREEELCVRGAIQDDQFFRACSLLVIRTNLGQRRTAYDPSCFLADRRSTLPATPGDPPESRHRQRRSLQSLPRCALSMNIGRWYTRSPKTCWCLSGMATEKTPA
jgi:hypothetical protein